MLKNIFTLFFFYTLSLQPMIKHTTNVSPINANYIIYFIPADVFLNEIFPKDPAEEDRTLILMKLYGSEETKYQASQSNLLTLLKFSRISQYFYNLLHAQIDNRVEQLSHTSCNNIFAYLSNDIEHYTIYGSYTPYRTISILLFREIKNSEGIYIHNTKKNEYLNLLASFTDNFKTQAIQNVCTNLQKECNHNSHISINNIETLERALDECSMYQDASKVHSYLLEALRNSGTTFAWQTHLKLLLITSDPDTLKQIENGWCNDKSLSHHISTAPQVLKHIEAYDSFIKELPSSISIEGNALTISTNCNLSNEPIIPINLIIDKIRKK